MAISRTLSGVSAPGMPKPSPRSTALTASISRSGTSLSHSATMNPTRATGAAHRNTMPKGVRVGVDDRGGDVGGQLVQHLRGLRPRPAPRRPPVRADPAAEEVGEQRSENRCAERTSQGPEERDTGSRDAEIAKLDGVLHDEGQHLHAQADPGAEDEQVERLRPSVSCVHPRQQTSRRAITAVPTIGKILYRPVRLDDVPLPMEVNSRPATIGSIRRPDTVAETPSTNCMNVGRKVMAPSIANPTMKRRTSRR